MGFAENIDTTDDNVINKVASAILDDITMNGVVDKPLPAYRDSIIDIIYAAKLKETQ
jgi:hypothetical protein